MRNAYSLYGSSTRVLTLSHFLFGFQRLFLRNMHRNVYFYTVKIYAFRIVV